MAKQNQEEYIRKLEQKQRDLEKFEEAVKANVAHHLKAANNAWTDLSKNRNPTKVCSDAVKSGVVTVSEKGARGVEALARLTKEMYEFDLILNFLREDDEGEDEE